MVAKKSFQITGMKRKGKKKKMENSFMLLPPEKTWKKVQRRVTGAMKGMEQFLYKKQLMGQGSSVRRGNTADMSGESKWGIIVYHLSNRIFREHQMKKIR